MKQLLLATALIALPVAVFSTFTFYEAQASVSGSGTSLGDLSAMSAIVADVQAIAATGDLTAAEKRITDFETAWDDAASKLRQVNKASWVAIDDASDAALDALRAGKPEPAQVTTTLATLLAELSSPSGGTASNAPATMVAGIAVTDETGHALPCEEMIGSLKTALTTAKLSDADGASATDFLAKATERCNADDDAHADEFSAQGLALASK